MNRLSRWWFLRLTPGARSNEMVSLMPAEYDTAMRVPLRILLAAVITRPAG